MGSHLEDLDGHEGYGARRLPDGTLSTTGSAADRVDAYLAACSCGWRGGAHPVDSNGYEGRSGSGRPTTPTRCCRHPPAEVADAISVAERAIATLAGERPAAALPGARRPGRWAEGPARRLVALAAVLEHTPC